MEAIVYLLAVHIDLIASAGKVWFPLTNISFVIYKRLKLDFFILSLVFLQLPVNQVSERIKPVEFVLDGS